MHLQYHLTLYVLSVVYVALVVRTVVYINSWLLIVLNQQYYKPLSVMVRDKGQTFDWVTGLCLGEGVWVVRWVGLGQLLVLVRDGEGDGDINGGSDIDCETDTENRYRDDDDDGDGDYDTAQCWNVDTLDGDCNGIHNYYTDDDNDDNDGDDQEEEEE